MTPPKLSEKEARDLIKKFEDYSKIIIVEPVRVLAIRGYYEDSMGEKGKNDRGIYDDAMFLIGPNLFMPLNANTDPSKYRPAFRGVLGIASLIPGLHYFKKGKHKIASPLGYAAFRPDTVDESLPVTRDGEEGIKKGIAINIHKGGVNTTSSEGCQTVYPDQWLKFQQTTYKAMDLEGQRRLPYVLITQD